MRLQKGRSHAAASRVQAERRSLISMARLEGGILQGRQGDRRRRRRQLGTWRRGLGPDPVCHAWNDWPGGGGRGRGSAPARAPAAHRRGQQPPQTLSSADASGAHRVGGLRARAAALQAEDVCARGRGAGRRAARRRAQGAARRAARRQQPHAVGRQRQRPRKHGVPAARGRCYGGAGLWRRACLGRRGSDRGRRAAQPKLPGAITQRASPGRQHPCADLQAPHESAPNLVGRRLPKRLRRHSDQRRHSSTAQTVLSAAHVCVSAARGAGRRAYWRASGLRLTYSCCVAATAAPAVPVRPRR